MRRLVLSLLAASSAALLTACGQGGSAFNASTNKIDRVVVSTAGQPPGAAKVVPGGQITLSAVGVVGSQNVFQPSDTNYTFNFTVAPVGTPYQGGNNAQDGVQGFCNGVTGFNFPFVTTATNGSTGATVPILQTAGTSDSVIFTAPSVSGLGPATTIVPFTDPAGNRPNGGNLASSYCVIINATHVSDGVVGSKVVYVGN